MVLGLAACNRAEETVAAVIRVAHAIVVEPASLAMPAGGQWQLAAEVNDAAGQPIGGAAIVYRSGGEAIAMVGPNGLVSSVGPTGTTYIEVISERRSVRVPVTVTAGTIAALELLNVPPATTIAGDAVGRIEIRARDAFGNGVSDVPLEWRVLSGDGSVEAAAAKSDVTGKASAQWLAGARVGAQVIEVRSGELAPLVVQSTAIAGPPASLVLGTDPPVSANAALPRGTSLDVKALLSDRNGNPVNGATIAFEALGNCPLDRVSRTDTVEQPASITWPLTTAGSCALHSRVEGSEIESRLTVRVAR